MRKRYSSIDPAKRIWNMMKLIVSSWYRSCHDILTKESSKPKIDPIFEIPKEEATPEFFKELLETSAFAKGFTRNEDIQDTAPGAEVTEIKLVAVIEDTESIEETVALATTVIAAVERAEAVAVIEDTEPIEETVALAATVIAAAKTESNPFAKARQKILKLMETGQWANVSAKTADKGETIAAAEDSEPDRLDLAFVAAVRKKVLKLIDMEKWTPVVETIAEVDEVEAPEELEIAEATRLLDLALAAETREKILTLMESGQWTVAEDTTFNCLKEFGASANEICEAPNTYDEDYIVMFLSLYSKLSYLYAFCLNRRQSHRASKVALLAPYIQTNPSKELIEACEAIARLRYEQKLPVVSLTVEECFQDAVKVALEAGVLPS